MNEIAKTLTVSGVALLAAVAAFVSARPTYTVETELNEAGQQLFPDFTDALKASSLEIVQYDEVTATPRSFKVQEVAGRWSIPSHHNYPTDAKNQLADAATSVIGLKILGVAGDSAGDHELYGVLDPAPSSGQVESGTVGVGTKVTIQDSSGSNLADLIIGKEQQGQSENRYVRRTGQNRVYTVEVSTSNLSTKFEDWIEDDLLKVNSWDVKQILIDNYSVNELTGGITPGDQLDLSYDDMATENKWKLVGLAEGEELNAEKLNELRDALDDLKIVDVARKPAGLSAELKTEEAMQIDGEALRSLQGHGFYISRSGQLVSNEGEIICRMKDGVEYALRFGEIAVGTGGNDDDEPSTGANRYVFITTRFNPSLIPLPELEPLPGEQPAPEPAISLPEDSTPGDEAAGPDEPCQEPQESGEDQDVGIENAAADQPIDVGQPADLPADEESTTEPDEIDLQIQRQRIEKENKRKQDEYDEKIKEGQEKAKDLNSRFADWYYVISDEVYRKIHVNRADIIKAGASAEENTLQEFQRLDEEGPAGGTQ